MNVKDFYYDLPEELIAQDPLEDRSSSRLMLLDKETGEIAHSVFKNMIDNTTKIKNKKPIIPGNRYILNFLFLKSDTHASRTRVQSNHRTDEFDTRFYGRKLFLNH